MPLYERAIFLLLALCVAFAPLSGEAVRDVVPGARAEASQTAAPCHEAACAHGHESASPCAENLREMPSHECCVSFAAIVPSERSAEAVRADREAIAFTPVRPRAARPADIYRPPWRYA